MGFTGKTLQDSTRASTRNLQLLERESVRITERVGELQAILLTLGRGGIDEIPVGRSSRQLHYSILPVKSQKSKASSRFRLGWRFGTLDKLGWNDKSRK